MFATAFIKRKLGVIHVTQSSTAVIIEGISQIALELDINKYWGTSTIAKNMFMTSNYSTVKVPHFFAPDLLYILNTLYKEGITRTPKRTLERVITLLREQTWLGKVDKIDTSTVDLSPLKGFSVLSPKDYQAEFVRHYIAVTTAFSLKGYMLDSAPGTGKTMSLLYLSQVLNAAGKKIFVVPLNAVNRVWEATINDLLIEDSPTWISTGNKPLTTDYKFYVVHYEQLELILEFVRKNQRAFEGTFVGLDESHNFNRLAASRTQFYVDLVSLPCIKHNVWSSGTPISALGSECIPFLKCVDPYFNNGHVEEAFRKIYGRDAKRANDILRHRIGHLKFFVPSQDAITIETNIIEYKVSMPGGEHFTMESIGKEIRAYMNERTVFYTANRPVFEKQYAAALAHFRTTRGYIKDPQSFEKYQRFIRVIAAGYDPKLHKEEAMYCNVYELKTIVPELPSMMAKEFKAARSVIKYVHLKVLGEGLGLLTKYRSACFTQMIPYCNLPDLIDAAKKKTIIFTSYVEAVETAGEYLKKEGYNPILIYGDTNKQLSPLVKKFYDDPDANPLIATFQSLSTAVPLIAANRIINLNQPFREAIKIQSTARAARLGQDHDVDVFDAILDTGPLENISTRNQDIIQWSADMVKSIMGTTNLDLETLSLESAIPEIEHDVGQVEVPSLLYHGSMYKQTELMPGFKRSGKLVKWDVCESNDHLYATTDPDEAILLGIGSALEKTFETTRYSYDETKRLLKITCGDHPVTVNDLWNLEVYQYRIHGSDQDQWGFNYNLQNGIRTEFKTQSTIKSNLMGCRKIDVHSFLNGWSIHVLPKEKK